MRFLWLLPGEFLVLVIALAGLGVMVGLVRIRAVGSLLGGIVLMLLLTPFIESFMASLPWWINLLVLVGLGWMLIQGFFRFVLGRGAADEMIGTLAADVVRAVLRGAFFTLLSPFRIIGWLLRRV
ncbi:MAG: hypothetical protein LC114_21325 [Bryobacterales bacterium]|nr:hypothetical protein [Bryobacterales bacterium]